MIIPSVFRTMRPVTTKCPGPRPWPGRVRRSYRGTRRTSAQWESMQNYRVFVSRRRASVMNAVARAYSSRSHTQAARVHGPQAPPEYETLQVACGDILKHGRPVGRQRQRAVSASRHSSRRVCKRRPELDMAVRRVQRNRQLVLEVLAELRQAAARHIGLYVHFGRQRRRNCVHQIFSTLVAAVSSKAATASTYSDPVPTAIKPCR
jgi:hypothetical protein